MSRSGYSDEPALTESDLCAIEASVKPKVWTSPDPRISDGASVSGSLWDIERHILQLTTEIRRLRTSKSTVEEDALSAARDALKKAVGHWVASLHDRRIDTERDSRYAEKAIYWHTIVTQLEKAMSKTRVL